MSGKKARRARTQGKTNPPSPHANMAQARQRFSLLLGKQKRGHAQYLQNIGPAELKMEIVERLFSGPADPKNIIPQYREWLGCELKAQQGALDQWTALQEMHDIARQHDIPIPETESFEIEHAQAIALKRKQVELLKRIQEKLGRGQIEKKDFIEYNKIFDELKKLKDMHRTMGHA